MNKEHNETLIERCDEAIKKHYDVAKALGAHHLYPFPYGYNSHYGGICDILNENEDYIHVVYRRDDSTNVIEMPKDWLNDNNEELIAYAERLKDGVLKKINSKIEEYKKKINELQTKEEEFCCEFANIIEELSKIPTTKP